MTLTINDLVWTFENVDPEDERLCTKSGNPCFGMTHFTSCEVYFRNDQPKALYRQTVLHELAHVFIFSYGIHLFVKNDEDDYSEEPFADFIGCFGSNIVKAADQIIKELYNGGVA